MWKIQILMISSIIQALFKIKIQHNMGEQEKKKRQRIYDLLHPQTKSKFLCLPYTKAKRKKLQEKSFFWGKGGVEDWTKNEKVFLTALVATAIKKDRTTSIRKHANELKFNEKTVRRAIQQDLSPDLNSLDYTIWDVLENKQKISLA